MIQLFLGGCGQNGHGFLVHETLKSPYLKNEFVNWADVLHTDNDAIIFS